mmetsp:Transcript_48116/g.113546  ORF Transcript_48116/g.113546 Transcript_48116/m.113546 type:complete len:250 (+) Transcript_48116:440-1189(+)
MGAVEAILTLWRLKASLRARLRLQLMLTAEWTSRGGLQVMTRRCRRSCSVWTRRVHASPRRLPPPAPTPPQTLTTTPPLPPPPRSQLRRRARRSAPLCHRHRRSLLRAPTRPTRRGASRSGWRRAQTGSSLRPRTAARLRSSPAPRAARQHASSPTPRRNHAPPPPRRPRAPAPATRPARSSTSSSPRGVYARPSRASVHIEVEMTGEENAHWLPACVHGTERHAQLRQCWEGHSVLWCAARERMERRC